MLICLSQNVQKVALSDSIVVERGVERDVERGVEKRQREAAPRGGLKLKGAPSVEPQITIHFHFLVQWLFWDKILRRFQIMTKVKENSFSVNHPNSVKPCHISWSTCINFETETTDVFFWNQSETRLTKAWIGSDLVFENPPESEQTKTFPPQNAVCALLKGLTCFPFALAIFISFMRVS